MMLGILSSIMYSYENALSLISAIVSLTNSQLSPFDTEKVKYSGFPSSL